MFENREETKPEEAYQLLEELELNQPKEVLGTRSNEEVEFRAMVWVEPGNASQRNGSSCEGMTNRISKTNMIATFSSPLMVGDVYRITFDRKKLNLTPAYAQCRKCRLLTEETFEGTLRFFAPVDLVPESMEP